MKYNRFEDLPVWKAALRLAVEVYRLTNDPFFSQAGDLKSQLRRAALSVSDNIAEGFERGSTAELLAFIYIARGSAGEVRSMLHFVGHFKKGDHLKSQIFRSEIACRVVFAAASRMGGQFAKFGHQGAATSDGSVA